MMTNTGNTFYFSREGDFQTKHQIFEIGGKSKTFEQIKDAKKPAFLVKDDILTSSKNVIPLYYFGFIY
jgi:hypothetical protein